MRTTNVTGNVLAALVCATDVLTAPTSETPLSAYPEDYLGSKITYGEAVSNQHYADTFPGTALHNQREVLFSPEQKAPLQAAAAAAGPQSPSSSTGGSGAGRIATASKTRLPSSKQNHHVDKRVPSWESTLLSGVETVGKDLFENLASSGTETAANAIVSKVASRDMSKIYERAPSWESTLLSGVETVGKDLFENLASSGTETAANAIVSKVASRNVVDKRTPSWESTLLSGVETVGKDLFENLASSGTETAANAIVSKVANAKRFT